MQRRHFLASMAAAATTATLGTPTVLRAQSAPVRIIVGAPPGGGTDTLARTLAMELSRVLGGNFVVENKPGAGGNIAASQVANSAPDGTTLLMCYTSHAINETLYADLSFDPVADFTPVCNVASAPAILCARPAFEANDIAELIALAKQSPGALNIALPGIGSAGHLAAEVLKTMAGIDMVSVPYKGTAQAINDVLAGQVDLMFAGLALAGRQLADKNLKGLGLSSIKPLAEYPALKPIANSLPGYDFNAWYGLLGPAKLDPALTEKYSAATRQVLKNEQVRTRMATEGLLATGSTPSEFQAFLVSEIERWGKIVKASGATAG